MLTQLIKLLERDKPRLIKPVYVFVLNYDEVVKRGLTDLMHTEPFETQPAKKRGGKKPPS